VVAFLYQCCTIALLINKRDIAMQHSEPFENEAMMSDEDYNKLQTIGKWMVGGMILASSALTTFCIIC